MRYIKFTQVLGSIVFLINFKKNQSNKEENSVPDYEINSHKFNESQMEKDIQPLFEYQTKANYHSKIEAENFRKFRNRCGNWIEDDKNLSQDASDCNKLEIINREKFKLADIDYYTSNLDVKILPEDNPNFYQKRIFDKLPAEKKIKIKLQKEEINNNDKDKNNLQNKQSIINFT
jgi:hypothetical protein